MHGGTTPRGIASPHFKTGRYSRYLPPRLAERFSESLADPDLLNLNREIALVDSRMEDLLKRVDSGESGRIWDALRTLNRDLRDAQRRRDSVMVAETMEEISKTISAGNADYAAWGEIASLVNQRRGLVESERRRLLDMQNMVTAEQAMLLIAAVVDSIRRNVNDRHVLAAISDDISRLTSATTGQRTRSGQ
jgi:hypothetical protein